MERDTGFGLRFRLLLGYHDLTLRDVSDATGAAISTVGTWRNGRVPSSGTIIEKIADLFHVTPAYLLYGGMPTTKEMDVDQALLEISNGLSKDSENHNRQHLLRQKVEQYFEKYLDEAEKYEGGLEHIWLQLIKEFPLDWFQRAHDFVMPRKLPEEASLSESPENCA